MSNHVLEPSFLHIIETFDVVSNLCYDLFDLEYGFFCISWSRLLLILDGPQDLILKHSLDVLLQKSLLQEEFDMSVIVIIAHDQAGFHQFVYKKLFLIEFFYHDF